MLPKIGEHRLEDLRVHRSRGVVIHVNRHLQRHPCLMRWQGKLFLYADRIIRYCGPRVKVIGRVFPYTSSTFGNVVRFRQPVSATTTTSSIRTPPSPG